MFFREAQDVKEWSRVFLALSQTNFSEHLSFLNRLGDTLFSSSDHETSEEEYINKSLWLKVQTKTCRRDVRCEGMMVHGHLYLK